ncbi:MAG: hypothetical protein LBV36_04990 [Chromatiales bacterium]|nr:hypothetical protein [Chromatiales bacterium]
MPEIASIPITQVAATNLPDAVDADEANETDEVAAPADEAAAKTDVAASPEASAIRPYMMFRSTALGETYGRVSLAYLDALNEPRNVTPLSCDRVYFAVDHGICLAAKRGILTTYGASIFDQEFNILYTFPLAGIPSRARLSPDGRLAAMTVFVSGHSYAGGDFSTRTSVVDTVTGQIVIEDLEKLKVTRDGAPFKGKDFNFWGITFTRDGKEFYATLATGGRFFMVKADLQTFDARIVHDDVECPSLSPDNKRVAFKRRVALGDGFGRFIWKIYVLDLETGEETEMSAETRNVDDQVEWLDNDHIIYALPDDEVNATAATNTWVIARDGSGAPSLLMPFAFSPAIVR